MDTAGGRARRRAARQAGGPEAAGSQAHPLVELVVGEAAHGGWCVAREPDGRVVFVRHALPGERVRARLTEATTRFARADAVEILDASPDRVQPPCPHARPGGCGGCDWQHASLTAQRTIKAAVVSQQLRRIAGLERDVVVEPLAGDDQGLGWRTRVRFAVGEDGTAGLRKHRSHEVIAVGDCPIAHPEIQHAGITHQPWPGASSVEAVAGSGPAGGPGELAIVVAPGRSHRGAAGAPGRVGGEERDAWKTAVEADSVLVARGGGLSALRGQGFVREAVAGRVWRVGAGVFWQVHPGAAQTLAGAVLEALSPEPGQMALDLYCGAGLFAGVLADAVGPDGTVIGVESDAAAVRDARHNLRHTPWARVHRGDVAEVLGRVGAADADIAVLDPPRAGVARPVLDLLLGPGRAGSQAAGGLRRVAYVSCDPATLARDIAVFMAAGWTLGPVRAFDAFPMTHHVECVATLTRE